LRRADETARLGRERAVERHEVGLAEELVERPPPRAGELAAPAGVDDRHAEPVGATGHRARDAAGADETERRAGELDPEEEPGLEAPPPARSQQRLRLAPPPRDREDQRERDGGGCAGPA